MTRVIVHAGYHKTGTTSLQDFLSQNRNALAPYLAYYGKMEFMDAGAMARIYGQKPFPHRLFAFRKAFRAFLNSIADHPCVVLSRETFSGGMPGHRRLSGRMITTCDGPAQKLAKTIIAELKRRFGEDAEITFFYTTRSAEDWLRSVHGHLLRSINLTDDFEQFRARFSPLRGPAEEARIMARALDPIPVVTAALEDHAKDPFGPARAVLDLAQVPDAARGGLIPAPRSNTGQTVDLRASFLDLNRRGLAQPELKAAKEAMIRENQR